MRFEGFVGGSYPAEGLKADAQDTLNLYAETIASNNGKVPRAMFHTPGLKLFTTLPETPHRGLWPGEGRLFAVAGSGLYEVFADGSYNRRGSVGNDGNPSFIAPNGDQIAISSAGRYYCDNGAGPVAINFTDSGDPVMAVNVVYYDGYFVIQQSFDSPQFFWTTPLDGTTISSLAFASKEAYPDNLISLYADHEELYLMGSEESSEVWQDVGALNNPFQRDPGSIMHYGCHAPFSVQRLGDGIAWLAVDQKRGGPFAVYAKGFQPRPISTRALENIWSGYPTSQDCIAYSYIENGHAFWALNFPSGNATWVYDLTENLWHRRGWWNGTSVDRHRVLYHAFVGLPAKGTAPALPRTHFGADWQNGNIYTVSTRYLDDAGTPIQRQRVASHIANPDALDRLYPQEFQLDSQVQDPSMTLEVAKGFNTDGTLAWHPSMIPSSTTTDANLQTARTMWRRLGNARTLTVRVTSRPASGIPQIWTGAYLKMLSGTK